MRRFGTAINYKTVALLDLAENKGFDNFIKNRDEYLHSINEESDSPYFRIDIVKIRKMMDYIANYIDSVTCEWEMKMCVEMKGGTLFIGDEINEKAFDFHYADIVYDYAQRHDLNMRMHTIIWHRFFPQSLKELISGKPASEQRDIAYKFIEKYTQKLASRYPNCYCVDVLNEIASDPDELDDFRGKGLPPYEVDQDGVRIDGWYKVLGKGYYVKVLAMARKIFGPNIKLFYNDNNETNEDKQKIFKTIIDNIKRYEEQTGTSILDGVGMQSHFWGVEPRDILSQSISFFESFGKEVQITEFDVSDHASKEEQKRVFEDFIEELKLHKIEAFTVWGLNDDISWLSKYSPTLVDKEYNYKSFFNEYVSEFSNKLRTKQ